MSEAEIAPPPPSSRAKGERRKRKKRVRRSRTNPPKTPRRILFGILVVVGTLVAALATYVLVVYPASAGPGKGKEVEVTLDANEPVSSVVAKLESAGLVASPRFFGLYVRVMSPVFAPGHHLLTDDASPGDLVRRLERLGNATRAKITIPEGWTRFDIAKRLHAHHVTTAATFLEATAAPDLLRELAIEAESAEGFLFPATYDLPLDSDPRDVVRRLKSEFDRRWTALEQNHRMAKANYESSLGWGKREIVTLASMVEKEAAVDDERPIVASVFLNRLRDPAFKKKVLQCDPTSGYGCLVLRDKIPSCAGYAGKITHAINFDPSNVYSTYIHEGLPPGPIANPGMKSLQAVLAPSSTKYLYFVARGEGRRHTFSETLEAHDAAVKDLKERQQPH
jgi:UPF0755 protein